MKSREFQKTLKEMNQEQLEATLSTKTVELSKMILMVKAAKADNYSEVKKLRKDIARIKTMINQLEA